MKTRVAILGASGRMGQALLQAAEGHPDVSISAALVRAGSPQLGETHHGLRYSDDLAAAVAGADVILDFSLPVGTEAALAACLKAKKPLVTGVTGLDAGLRARLAEAGKTIPVLAAPNMSLGVALLTRMATEAARVLGPGFELEIAEAHHQHKKDAPSGTALALGEALAKVRGLPVPTGKETPAPGVIGFTVVRSGEIVGDHTVHLSGATERLELTHRALSRSTFALGALRAAHWIAGKPAGVYTLADTLQA